MTGWGRTVVAVGSGVLLAATVGTWLLVDLERAGWVASVVGGAVGVAGLAFTLLTGAYGTEATDTGNASATAGGLANSGVLQIHQLVLQLAPGEAESVDVRDALHAYARRVREAYGRLGARIWGRLRGGHGRSNAATASASW
ncbi:hypothetical protein [Streptomyces triticirhizae]|uniref:Uncharacterized protein n=1 Tax=Streptomyces triticirhizae TaxID=2483353 RepID=A0A3M2LDB2_9ACTN|nr:hypothetical protein [Streptomyces triticirhizae]RMI34750.1 hypothetical protein EBN88_23140 [Streptomyces triticirhizae]